MKLQLGKKYVARNGDITAPLVQAWDNSQPFQDGWTKNKYCENGKYYYEPRDSQYDLISEYVEPCEELPNEKTDAEKLSESLMAACKAAGIDNPRFVAQDKGGNIYHYTMLPYKIKREWLYHDDDEVELLDHDEYADDWRESLMEWCNKEQETQKPSGIEALVCDDIAARQQVGIAKYGTSLADNPLTTLQTLQHAYEESLDFPIYLKKLILDMQSVKN
jgi:hypothetical protein